MQFSKSWIKSKKPKKQRLYRFNAPLHLRQKFVSCHLSKELRKKYGARSIGLKKGDKVNIVRGHFKGKTGKVESVSLKDGKSIISGIDIAKKDGTKTRYPVVISNLVITELNLDDKMRQKSMNRKKVNKNE